MNTKGETVGSQVMVIWFLFLLVIGAGGLALGIRIFFGADYDFREAEAGILNYRIQDCLAYHSIDFSKPEMFYTTCGLSKEILSDKLNETKLAIKICEKNCDEGKTLFQLGSDFTSCDLTGKNEYFMRCSKSFVSRGEMNFQVITGSNHQIRRENA